MYTSNNQLQLHKWTTVKQGGDGLTLGNTSTSRTEAEFSRLKGKSFKRYLLPEWLLLF